MAVFQLNKEKAPGPDYSSLSRVLGCDKRGSYEGVF